MGPAPAVASHGKREARVSRSFEALCCEAGQAHPENCSISAVLVPHHHPPVEAFAVQLPSAAESFGLIVGAVYIGNADGQRVTVLVCRPMPDYEPTIMQFWERNKLAESKAVYFCPNSLLIVRPTEGGDESLVGEQS